MAVMDGADTIAAGYQFLHPTLAGVTPRTPIPLNTGHFENKPGDYYFMYVIVQN